MVWWDIVVRACSPYESSAVIMSSICMKSAEFSPKTANRRLPNLLILLTSPSKDAGAEALSLLLEWSLTVVLDAASMASARSFCDVTSASVRQGTANGVRPLAAEVSDDSVVSPSHARVTIIVSNVFNGRTFDSDHFMLFSIERRTKVNLSDLLRFFSANWLHSGSNSSAVPCASPLRFRSRSYANVPIPSVSDVVLASFVSSFVVAEDVCIALKAFMKASGDQSAFVFCVTVGLSFGVAAIGGLVAGDVVAVVFGVLCREGKRLSTRCFFHLLISGDG